ncbi:MAG: hypothetical protein P1U35_05295 [Cycloclasticus sp.]|jgi:transposase|nr:hypothetical protein [Cycloclasticus sp.]
MAIKTRKISRNFTLAQKLEYVKLMIEEHYSNRQVLELSGAGPTSVPRWKKQYLAGQRGEVTEGKTPLDSDKRRIQELGK